MSFLVTPTSRNLTISKTLKFPGTRGRSQSKSDFNSQLDKIKSKSLRDKVLKLFSEPSKLTGLCFSCRYKRILINEPKLVVKSIIYKKRTKDGRTVKRTKGGRTVMITGKCFHPELPKCVGKISKIIGRDLDKK